MAESKRAYPLWEQKEKYVEELDGAKRLLIRYKSRSNPRDFRDMKAACISCWMNIRSYRDLLEKKSELKPWVNEFEELIYSDKEHDFEWWAKAWMFLKDAYKRVGIDDMGKREDEDDYRTAVLEGLFE